VAGDRVSLQQVVLNLIVNAMDAVEAGSPVERLVVVRTRLADSRVECAVTDTGAGVAEADLPRIFEPFFTTKEDGVGLGLVVARSLAEAQDGRLWVDTASAGGATFRVSLPASSAHLTDDDGP
jgi:C4-dicarboxylate-specific signal transduction histidine kinase